MTENSNVHSNIQSQQFNTFKSSLILAKIIFFAFGAFVFCLLGLVSLELLCLGAFVFGDFVNGASVRRAFDRAPVQPPHLVGFPELKRISTVEIIIIIRIIIKCIELTRYFYTKFPI